MAYRPWVGGTSSDLRSSAPSDFLGWGAVLYPGPSPGGLK
jgi:hypothetical protein